jgi:hypothetical protein
MEKGLFKIKRPVIPPVIPPTPPTPVFDYVIDIYSDKVIVTNPDGSTTQLSTISDLNNWLRNVTGKRIRINANVEVWDDLTLTPNEYWIYGGWLHGNIYLLSGKHTIISFTGLGDLSTGVQYNQMLRNVDPQTGNRTNVSGLMLYSVYADADISGTSDMVLTDVLIRIEYTYYTYLAYINGDVYIHGSYMRIENSTLRNAYIDVELPYLANITGTNGEVGTWMIRSLTSAEIEGSVNVTPVDATLLLRVKKDIYISPNTSITIDLPAISYDSIRYRVVFIGVHRVELTPTQATHVYDSLPSGVTWYFDLSNKKLVITNSTTNAYDLTVELEIMTGY